MLLGQHNCSMTSHPITGLFQKLFQLDKLSLSEMNLSVILKRLYLRTTTSAEKSEADSCPLPVNVRHLLQNTKKL